MENISLKRIKANKDHKCDWCLFKINKGETYCKSFNVSDGEGYTWKNHIHCANLMDAIGAYDSGDGISTEYFREYVNNEYQLIMSKYHNDIYESKDFKYPNFETQLNFILEFHKIKKN